MARKPLLRSGEGDPWLVASCQPSGAGRALPGTPAGAVELRPGGPPAGGAGPGSAGTCYRLALLREPDGWRLVTEWLGAEADDGDRADSSWSSSVESLGELRAEVERLWGESVWLALLRASADAVQAIAPKAMEPKLDLLLPARRFAWAGAG